MQFILQCVWPESSPADFTGAADIDVWWKTIEEKIIEAAVFYTAPPIHLEADKIAPCRARQVVNTEHLKGMCTQC